MRRFASRSGAAVGLWATVAAAVLLAFVVVPTPGRSSGPVPAAEAADPTLRLTEAWPGVAFESPISAAATGDDGDRVLVALRGGKVLVLPKWRGSGPVAQPKVFLDLTSKMTEETIDQGQGGLLAVACAPDYKTSGRFAVCYGTGTGQAANPFRTVVVIYTRSANADAADPASGVEVLSVRKVAASHFGGGLRFGPDGHLYVGIGDSGIKFDPAGDPKRVSQDMKNLEGKILRLDVRASSAAKPYAIPADNPWAQGQGGARPEIYAYGVRNPWRFSFDREAKTLWLGDPGQQKKEEIDVVPRGANLGWAMMEGDEILTTGAKAADYVAPVYAYGREFGSAVIGGVVYRGQRCPSLRGKYVFAEYMSGKVAALPLAGERASGAPSVISAKPEADPYGAVSVDEDAQGELLFCYLDDGKIYTLTPAQ